MKKSITGTIKNILKILSGRPKSGNIIECIKPIEVIGMFIISFFFMYWAILFNNIFLGVFSMMFSWQVGWGMSIERFINDDENKEV